MCVRVCVSSGVRVRACFLAIPLRNARCCSFDRDSRIVEVYEEDLRAAHGQFSRRWTAVVIVFGVDHSGGATRRQAPALAGDAKAALTKLGRRICHLCALAKRTSGLGRAI